MKLILKLLLVSVIFNITLFFPKAVTASEGTISLRSTNNESYRCWASSLFMPNNRYKVSIGCVDLIYPPQPPDLYEFYILWANPIESDRPLRLGVLGGGKANFDAREPFSELYVSLEEINTPREPSRQIVMRGGVEPISFLLRPLSPTSTPTISAKVDEENPEGTQEEQVDTSQLSTREKIVLALRRAGIAAVVALIIIVGLVFVVSRSRG